MARKSINFVGRYLDLTVTAIEVLTGKDGEEVAKDMVRYTIVAAICITAAAAVAFSVPNTEIVPTIFGVAYASAYVKGGWKQVDSVLKKCGEAVIVLFYKEAA